MESWTNDHGVTSLSVMESWTNDQGGTSLSFIGIIMDKWPWRDQFMIHWNRHGQMTMELPVSFMESSWTKWPWSYQFILYWIMDQSQWSFAIYSATDKHKMVKPFTRLQSHGQSKKWLTVVASLMLIACLVAKSILADILPLPTHCDLASRSRSSKREWAYMASTSLQSCQVWM